LDVYELLVREAEALANQPTMIPSLISGDDLIALGLKPGPAVGALLHEIRDKQLQEELNTREQALDWAKKKIGAAPAGRTME
jgi:hypothetical protein